MQGRHYPSRESWHKTKVERLLGKFSINIKNTSMLISAFFPKLMEKLKHGSMLLRTEESVRFPGLGERTKRWRNYYLESQLMSTDSGDERKEPALEPGPRHLFHLSRKAHPAFRSERAEVPGIQASGMMPARHGTSSFYRFPPLLSPHHRLCPLFLSSLQGQRRRKEKTALFSTEGSPHALGLYI